MRLVAAVATSIAITAKLRSLKAFEWICIKCFPGMFAVTSCNFLFIFGVCVVINTEKPSKSVTVHVSTPLTETGACAPLTETGACAGSDNGDGSGCDTAEERAILHVRRICTIM